MTIAATPRRSPVYTGNGVATTYAFSFKVLDATTLVVTVADANDLNSAVLVNGVDYTVTLNPDQDASPGGEIAYAGLPVGHRLVITSATDASQPTALTNLGQFHANVIEAALDRIVIQHQQQQEQLDRCVKVVATSEQDPTTLLDNAVTSTSNYATAAAASASAAQTARTGAEAALDAFDDRYLGAKASDPTTDNDGNPLIDGALYWNTATKRMRIYSLATTSWGPFPATAADVAVTPAGNIVATDAQAAIEELDTEKVAKAGDTMTGALNVPMVVTDSPLSFRNKIINGGFDVWQRGTSQTATGYGSDDRWANGNVGSAKTHSRQVFTVGQTDVPGNPKYYSRTVVTSVAGAGNYAVKFQKIEGVRTFAGKTVTLSFYAKADAPKSIAIEFQQEFGTGGAPSALVQGIGAQKVALTASWQRFEVTVAIPSITGKTLGSNGDDSLGVFIWFDAGSDFNARTATLGQQSGTFDIANVQLEEGSVATPFEQLPPGETFRLCQRYYQRTFDTLTTTWMTGAVFTNGGSVCYPLPVRMRAAPTITANDLIAANFSSSGSPPANKWGLQIQGVVAASISAGSMSVSLYANHLNQLIVIIGESGGLTLSGNTSTLVPSSSGFTGPYLDAEL